MSEKILVVFTGGTIGSCTNKGITNLDATQKYKLLEAFNKTSELDIQFVTIQPLNILSENCTPKDWLILLSAIKESLTEDLSGVIITHGTDTLPYTSALISYVFAQTKIPIILTASNKPLEHLESNGLSNFTNSVEFIHYSKLPGVFVIYRDNNCTTRIYLGTRMSEMNPVDNQLPTYPNISLGTLVHGVLQEDSYKKLLNKEKSLNNIIITDLYHKNDVMLIHSYPGLNYDFYKFDEKKPCAVLHMLYHSSTGCISGGTTSILDYIKYCRDNAVDIYIPMFQSLTDSMYSTTEKLLIRGAIPLYNITAEAALVKLWLGYNLGLKNPKDFILKNIYHEFISQ